MKAKFVDWFTIKDFGALWDGVLGQDTLSLTWRDIGLFDGSGVARPVYMCN